MPVNNYELIKPLLKFRSDDDFYFAQIIQRKKDYAKRKVNGTNNNSRLIKAYYVRSIEYLDFIMPELISLAEVFKARVGIDLNRRSVEKIAFQCLRKVADQIMNKDYDKVYKAYPTVCGRHTNEPEKKWILDIDDPTFNDFKLLDDILKRTDPVGPKIVVKLPTNSGWHVITDPFNIKQFSEYDTSSLPEISIHKRNPTLLFCPNLN